MARIKLMCPMCELGNVVVKEWRKDFVQGCQAPWVVCPICKWNGFLRVND